jgi:hypothetical protein
MNAISRMAYTNDYSESAQTVAMGLGPNQLSWLRRTIDSFKQAEEQWILARQDAVRAARLAGLI